MLMFETRFVVVGAVLLAFITGFFVNILMLRNGYLLDLANVQETESYVEGETSSATPLLATVTVTATVTTTVEHSTRSTCKPTAQPPPPTPPPKTIESPPPSNKTEVPFCHRNYKFLVLSTQRSGTHYFVETLHLNPDFHLGGEIFKADYVEAFQEEFNLTGTRLYHNFTRKELVPMMSELIYGFGPSYTRRDDVYRYLRLRDGFIFHHNQAKGTPELLPLLAETKGWRAIHLVRQNAFHVYVSQEMLRITRSAHCTLNEKCDAHEITIRLDPKATIEALARHERVLEENREMLKEYRFRYTEVTYEGLLDGSESFCDIWKFSECSCVPVKPIGTVKSVNRKYSEIVENFAEVKEAIMKTQFAKHIQNVE